MSTLLVIEYLSVDGVAQAPGHDGEDPDNGFALGGWAGPHLEDHREYGTTRYQNASAFLFGRRTFELWRPHWSQVSDPDDHIAAALNTRPKYVVSTTMEEPAWSGTTVLAGDIPEQVGELKLKHGPGPIVLAGSTQLAQTLIDNDLVDAYDLWIHPIVLGTGKRLFEPPLSPQQDLRLVSTCTTRTGLMILTFERR
jgi:dihydrofolate reductase